MWDHIINIHPSELLHTKPKSLKLMNIKIKKKDNIHFLHNNILTKLFKELKKKITINNIYIIYLKIILCILMYIF